MSEDTLNELQALDGQIRKAGSSLYGLLSLLAGQFLGVPREPPPEAFPNGEASTKGSQPKAAENESTAPPEPSKA